MACLPLHQRIKGVIVTFNQQHCSLRLVYVYWFVYIVSVKTEGLLKLSTVSTQTKQLYLVTNSCSMPIYLSGKFMFVPDQ